MRFAILFITMTMLVTDTEMTASEPAVLDIGSRRELFVDGFLIDRLQGAQLRLHRPTPRGVAVVHDKPWEGSSSAYKTVIRDGDIYRMYYRGSDVIYTQRGYHSEHPEFACYAESDDGIRWTKPELGLVEFKGSKKNNIIWAGVGTHNFAPFKDSNPNCKPDERYKALAGIKRESGLFALKSADGIHWSLMRDKPVITKGAFDSQNLAFWDATRGEYREYLRDFRNGRDIRTSTSKDFLNWSDPKYLSYAQPLHHTGGPAADTTKKHPPGRVSQLYTNQITSYYRAPHIFLGFPTRYIDRGWSESAKALPQLTYRKLRGAKSQREGTAVTDGMIMASRDGQRFRIWPESFVRPGIQRPGSWFYGDSYQNWGLVETKSDRRGAPNELSIYVSEDSHQGDSVTWRRHTLRIDGFVSVQAPLAGGQCTTKPLRFRGDELSLNLSTSAAGSVRVEIQDESGKPIPRFALSDCYEIYGDKLDRSVVWKGGRDVSSLAGKTVRLRFEVKDADLYSFQFRPRHLSK